MGWSRPLARQCLVAQRRSLELGLKWRPKEGEPAFSQLTEAHHQQLESSEELPPSHLKQTDHGLLVTSD